MSYAILWSENDGPEFAGRLTFEPGGVNLTGTEVQCDLRFTDLAEVYLERRLPARHTWRPSLVLVTTAGGHVDIGSLQGLGALHELAEEVAARRGKPAT